MFTTLISAADLVRYGQSNWVILDCRHDLTDPQAGRAAYTTGHLPHAQFAHLDIDLSGNKVGANGVFHGRHPLPDRAAFLHILRSWGINNGTQVVAYDAHGGMFAARLWWLLRWVGHSSVAVLDGGMDAWLELEPTHYQLSTKIPSVVHGEISERNSLVSHVRLEDVVANLGTQSKILVDARSPDRFRGENETMDPVGGHIPGAINRFFKHNLQASGRFKSPDELRSEWSAIITNPKSAIMQCGSGVTACHNLLAMEVAGMPGAALYSGSWSEWCSVPSRSVAVG
jgi:thiosulfate/3-mercaptopyruvate sulfurtransferase